MTTEGLDSRRAEVLAGLASIPASQWDRLIPPGAGSLRHGFLRAWEHVDLAGLVSRPIVARSSGVPVGAAAGYVYDFDMAAVPRPYVSRAIGVGRRFWPGLLKAKVYELGAPAAHVPPLVISPHTDQHATAATLLGAAIEEAGRAGASMVIVQDLVPAGGPVAAALRAHGFSPVPALPTALLELEHPSFEGYLRAMNAKYRYRARRVLKRSRHLEVERLETFDHLAGSLTHLWRQVYERATETRREVLNEAFFAAASAEPNLSLLVLRRHDGSLAAFGLVMEDRPWLHFLQCGFAAEAGPAEAAYFRLLLEVVRVAIEDGLRIVNLGCTTIGPKMDLGARAVGLCAWLRHRSALSQRVFIAAGNGRFAPPPPPVRHVFRG